MSKKNKNNEVGQVLLKNKLLTQRKIKSSQRHTSHLQDGQDYNRIDFNSITEQSDVDSFLSTAELAGKDYKAEKLNVKIINPCANVHLEEEDIKLRNLHNENREFLRIPRRPLWDRSMSPDELSDAERDSFLKWRRLLGIVEEEKGVLLTPFEKNIEFWRQLWRVIERSDVVIQIVDARNPLLFYCEDLCKYVKEVDPGKENLLLVNKADFLTEEQRCKWAKYFDEEGIKSLFFSAVSEINLPDIGEVNEEDGVELSDETAHINLESGDEGERVTKLDPSSSSDDDEYYDCIEESFQKDSTTSFATPTPSDSLDTDTELHDLINSSKLLTKEELIIVFKSFLFLSKLKNYVTIGLVGYPNVGKSSTINCLMDRKRVSVSATPGKTKHFQTLFLSEEIMLCDCPGLVFPAFVTSKEEMIVYGILPVDQMRDHVPPMNLVLSLFPRAVLESKYGVTIPSPPEGEDQNRSPNSEEFLTVYGYMRGYMTPRGIPDHPRSARYILKDFINGKLLYCCAPPTELQETYHVIAPEKVRLKQLEMTPQQSSLLATGKSSKVVDASFFNSASSAIHFKGRKGPLGPLPTSSSDPSTDVILKPWRLKSKRNTRQKARRKFAHLDQ